MSLVCLLPLALPAIDPVALLEALPPGPGRFLLESGPAGPSDVRRHTFLGAEPFMTLVTCGQEARIAEGGRTRVCQGDPFAIFQGLLDQCRVDAPAAFPGLPGGAVGYFGYELGRQVERLPDTPPGDLGVPDLSVSFYDVVVVIDHEQLTAHLAVGAPDGRETQAMARASRWEQTLKQAIKHPVTSSRQDNLADRHHSLESPFPCDPVDSVDPPAPASPVRSSLTRAAYRQAVTRALEYIRAGDIFQVNLAQRFTAPYSGSGWDLYRRIRTILPAPFAAFLDLGPWQVVSASPERFLTVRGHTIETRPIKGTRPRGATPAEDHRNADELLASAKDAAELVMIVDLQRNDLGRLCEYGTVTVPDLRRLEATPNVWHTVATVQGRLRPRVTAAEILRATFPGGSITGAPKVRAMEIITELEPVRRDVYTGAIGYIGFDGRIDLNIAIRTAIVRGGFAHFHAGGGIVADSDPDLEYAETIAKGSGIARALGVSLQDLP